MLKAPLPHEKLQAAIVKGMTTGAPIAFTERVTFDKPIVFESQRGYAPLSFVGNAGWDSIVYTGPDGSTAFTFNDLKDANISGLHVKLMNPRSNGVCFRTTGSSSRVTLSHASASGGFAGFRWEAPGGADMCLWEVRQCWTGSCHIGFEVEGENALEFLFSQCASSGLGVDGIRLVKGGSGSVIQMYGASDVADPIVVKGGYNIRVTDLVTERATCPFTYGGDEPGMGGCGQVVPIEFHATALRDTRGPLAKVCSAGVTRMHFGWVKGADSGIVAVSKPKDPTEYATLVLSGVPVFLQPESEGNVDVIRLY